MSPEKKHNIKQTLKYFDRRAFSSSQIREFNKDGIYTKELWMSLEDVSFLLTLLFKGENRLKGFVEMNEHFLGKEFFEDGGTLSKLIK